MPDANGNPTQEELEAEVAAAQQRAMQPDNQASQAVGALTGYQGARDALSQGDYRGAAMNILDPVDIFGFRAGNEAAAQQAEAQRQASAQVQGIAQGGLKTTDRAMWQGRGDIRQGTAMGANVIGQGTREGLGSLQRSTGQAAGAMRGGYGSAQQQLAQRMGQGTGEHFGLGALQAQQRGLGQVDARARMDPGMEFRRQQGEESLARMRAAKGGRASGRAMQELAEFNQGLASQEYAAAHQRAMQEQQAGFGQQAAIAQMGQGAQMQQQGRLDALAGQRAGYAAQGGQSLGNLYAQQGRTAAGMQYGAGQQIGNLYAQQGQSLADLGMGYNQQRFGYNQLAAEDLQRAAGYAGMEQQQQANTQGGVLSTVGSLVGMFSDERLKKNIAPAGYALDAMLEEITPARFEYQDASHGDGEFYGVMAQDLESTEAGKGLVVELDDGKAIHVHKAVSLLLATVARLNERIKELEGARG